MKILMVCLGNICRSPLAEGILTKSLMQNKLNWSTDSAGTSGWHAGESPDRRSIQVASKYDIDISHQKSRKIRQTDITEFDLILAMDSQNLSDLRSFFGRTESEKIRLITDYSQKYKGQDVPDPYYDDDGFEKVFEMLQDCINGLLSEVGRN